MSVKESISGDVVTVQSPIDPDTRDVTRKLMEDQSKTVVFEDLNGGKAVGNLFSTREKIAAALNVPRDGIVEHLLHAITNPEPCEVVDMSKSYCDSGMILAVKEDSEYADTIKSLADCDGLKVAVKEGATSYNVAQSFLDENPDVSYEIVQYKDTVGCVSDLLAGRVDVVVNDLLNQKILSQEYEGTKIVCDPFTHAENAIAVQKGKDDLLAFINECIDDYYADGTYDALWTKWIDASGDGEEAASAAEDTAE